MLRSKVQKGLVAVGASEQCVRRAIVLKLTPERLI